MSVGAAQYFGGGGMNNPNGPPVITVPGVRFGPLYHSSSGADASLRTDFHHLFTTPNVTGMATLDDYADSSNPGTTIYQLAGGVYNSGTRNAVGVAGFARGQSVWGGNIVAMADGDATATVTGLEIDFGIQQPNSGATAIGLSLHSHFAQGNPAGYLQMLARYGADTPAPRYGIQISVNGGTDQPLQATGVIFEVSGALQTQYGIDWHAGAFSAATIYIPHNRGSAGASVGVKVEARGGFANSGPMLQFSAIDAASTAAYGIRFATAAGTLPPVSATGTLIYVDGGTYGIALDISAATFSAAGAIRMGDNNISFGTVTGTKLGTSTAQKLAFFNSTPIVQYTTKGTTIGFTAGAGTAVDSAATFTGNTGANAYTIGDIVRALKQYGLIAP